MLSKSLRSGFLAFGLLSLITSACEIKAPEYEGTSVYDGEKENPYGGKTPVTPNPNPATPQPQTGDGKGVALAEIKDVQVLDLIENDVRKLGPSEAPRTRYFSLHVASNAGLSGDALEGQRLAFTKILNSISTKSQIMKPTAVDKDRIIYRVNLDDIGMSPELFDQVVQDHYPFNKHFVDIGSAESISAEDADGSLRRLLDTNLYLIRMDWFTATAALPIPYQKFMQFPQNLSDFEEQTLGRRVSLNSLSSNAKSNLDQSQVINGQVDLRIANIVNNNVLRTGFDNSNVSFSNRIVERHEGQTGGYYISYDFFLLKLGENFKGRPANQADLDQHNINTAPLGPKGTNKKNGVLEFNHDGGEVIFMLNNGLFGYYLIDAAGTLLDKGPINVVRQNTAPPEFTLAITNGHSCMSCHNAGLLVQNDSILSGVNQNKNAFLASDLSRINQIYNPTEHRRKLDQDNVQYFAAMKEMGLDPFKPDPVDAAFRFYNRPLTKKDIQMELALSDSDMLLLQNDAQFKQLQGALTTTQTVSRAVFQALVPSIVEKFKQDINLSPPEQADFIVNADCMDDDVFQMDTCILQPQFGAIK